jgi:glycosyltransferase involved in cell wall biosynthesis
MKVACHYAIPRPPHPELDAAVQDGMQIIAAVGGEINFLYPWKKAKFFFPRFFCGIHQLGHLRRVERRVDVHHIFSNGFYPYPVLMYLRKPIVVSSVIGLSGESSIQFPRILRHISQFIVPADRDRRLMESWGYQDVHVITPGIDLQKFSISKYRDASKFVVLSGSAPWNHEQFSTKGVDLLLAAARKLPWLHIIFLWRGRLLDEMKKKVKRSKIESQVTILADQVDVNEVLRKVHAGIVIAANRKVVKGYPHSLLEALATGKPIVASGCLQIAKYISNHGVGEIVESMRLEDVVRSLERIRVNYYNCVHQVVALDLTRFSQNNMINQTLKVYEKLGCM